MSFPLLHFPDAHFPNAHFPHEAVIILQGGGGGKKRRETKSWDQRERERQEQLRLDAEARQARENKARFGDMPKALEEALQAPSPEYKRLSPEVVKAYQDASYATYSDDEEAMALIMALI